MPRNDERPCRQLDFDSWPCDKPLANLRFATDVPRGGVRWLWPQRLPLGRIALLVGDPGVGKSLLLADLAARHSAGLPFPPSHVPTSPRSHPARPPAPSSPPPSHVPTFPHSHPTAPPAGVLFVSPEDGLSATLQPRLVAAGAALKNILLIDGVRSDKYAERPELPFTLPEHFDLLADAIQSIPAPRLLILDPFIALLTPAAHAARLIAVLGRLSTFAACYDAAVVAVAHLVKAGSQRVLYRIRGSLTISGAARAALLLSQDPLHPNRRVLSVIKSVYSAPAPPLAFDIAPGPRLEWHDPPGDALSDFPLRCPLVTDSAEAHSALHDACTWLLDFLATGPRDVHTIYTAAARDGHAPGTLRRAKRLLGLHSNKPNNESSWQWSSPDAINPRVPADAPPDGPLTKERT